MPGKGLTAEDNVFQTFNNCIRAKPHFYTNSFRECYGSSLCKDLESNCKSSQHSRLWYTSTLTHSPEAMLMISLTIASWASSYSSLFFIYSSLTELSLLWTKPQYLEAATFCLHCCNAKLLDSYESIPVVPTCFNSKVQHKATALWFIHTRISVRLIPSLRSRTRAKEAILESLNI